MALKIRKTDHWVTCARVTEVMNCGRPKNVALSLLSTKPKADGGHQHKRELLANKVLNTLVAPSPE